MSNQKGGHSPGINRILDIVANLRKLYKDLNETCETALENQKSINFELEVMHLKHQKRKKK